MSGIAVTTPQTGAEVLTGAIVLLRSHEWCQRAWRRRDRQGQVVGACVGGAIYDSAKHGISYNEAMTALQQVIGTRNVDQWNDAPGRTKAEILAALESARGLLGTPTKESDDH